MKEWIRWQNPQLDSREVVKIPDAKELHHNNHIYICPALLTGKSQHSVTVELLAAAIFTQAMQLHSHWEQFNIQV